MLVTSIGNTETIMYRDGSRTSATSKMERFVIIVDVDIKSVWFKIFESFLSFFDHLDGSD